MKHISNSTAILLGTALIMLTLISVLWHSFSISSAALSGATILLLAGIKSRAVILYFMDLRNAPKAWKISFDVWVLTTTFVLMTVFVLTVRVPAS